MIQCYNGDCKSTILKDTVCNNCCTDNTLEALEIAFKYLEYNDLKNYNEFMLAHFPLKDIRDRHETRLLLLEKDHLVTKLQKIKKKSNSLPEK